MRLIRFPYEDRPPNFGDGSNRSETLARGSAVEVSLIPSDMWGGNEKYRDGVRISAGRKDNPAKTAGSSYWLDLDRDEALELAVKLLSLAGQQIRNQTKLDDDLCEMLKQRAKPPEDTVSDVLRRIFRMAGIVPGGPLLAKNIDELELSFRTYNCLKNAGIRTVGELVTQSEVDLMGSKHFGRKSLNEIKEILQRLNLTLGMDLSRFQE
jgi:hypothetical protein